MNVMDLQTQQKVDRLEQIVRLGGWGLAVLLAGALVVGLGFAVLQEQREAPKAARPAQ
jgi:hypothetical protein